MNDKWINPLKTLPRDPIHPHVSPKSGFSLKMQRWIHKLIQNNPYQDSEEEIPLSGSNPPTQVWIQSKNEWIHPHNHRKQLWRNPSLGIQSKKRIHQQPESISPSWDPIHPHRQSIQTQVWIQSKNYWQMNESTLHRDPIQPRILVLGIQSTNTNQVSPYPV